MYMYCLYCMSWIPIRSFSEIEILPNTLVVCDIDDTLIHHPFLNGSWMDILRLFFSIETQKKLGRPDNEIATKLLNEYLDEVMISRPIEHTDKSGFFEMVEKADKVVFLTARSPNSVEFTSRNLWSVGVDTNNHDLHFSYMTPKGEYIMNHFFELLITYDHIVFIDDQIYNLDNVLSQVAHPGLRVYKFEHIKDHPHIYYPFPPTFHSHLRFDGNDLEFAEGMEHLDYIDSNPQPPPCP